MDPASSLASVFAAFGLSAAAGLNAWIPLLAVSLGGRFGWLDLGESYQFLSSTPALGVVGACLVLDFVGDKVAGVDHVLHAAGAVIQPVAGAILFAAQTGVVAELDPTLALVLGALVSGSVHAERSALRPLSTTGTAGLANPVLSAVEDAGSATLTLVAFLVPVLALVLAVGLLACGLVAWRRLRRRRPRAGAA